MSVRKSIEIDEIIGNEGTKIKQYFHPHNTLNGISYSIASFSLDTGKRTLKHKLKSSEVYFVLDGEARIFIDGDKHTLGKNDSVYISPMSEQFIENIGKGTLKFLCIVEPAWKREDEIILE